MGIYRSNENLEMFHLCHPKINFVFLIEPVPCDLQSNGMGVRYW